MTRLVLNGTKTNTTMVARKLVMMVKIMMMLVVMMGKMVMVMKKTVERVFLSSCSLVRKGSRVRERARLI